MLLLLSNDISHHSFIHATFTIQISVAFVILTVVEVFIYKLKPQMEYVCFLLFRMFYIYFKCVFKGREGVLPRLVGVSSDD